MNNWTDWHGGEMPVPKGTPIEVEHRDGTRWVTRVGNAYALRWWHSGNKRDIIRYRLHKPQSDTAARLETALRELEAAQAAYEAECRQWEPEGGRHVVAPDGDVVVMPAVSDFQGRFFGTERPTRQLAEQARDAMRIHNRALAYVHEHAPEWDGSDPAERWCVFREIGSSNSWVAYHDAAPAVGAVTGPRHVMEQLAGDLNNGRVKL